MNIRHQWCHLIWVFAATALCTQQVNAGVRQRLPLPAPEDLEVKWFLDSHPDNGPYPSTIFNQNTGAIRYHLGAETYSEENAEAELDSIRVAFGQWQSVPGTALRFEEAGVIEGELDINTSDGINLVYWENDSTIVANGKISILNRTALTLGTFWYDGSILEMDIVFNGVQFLWFTDHNALTDQRRHVESTALHEIGHLLGLAHSPTGGSTMNTISLPGIGSRHGLSTEEIAFAQSVYPDRNTGQEIGGIAGSITMGGSPVFGAIVSAENSVGNLVSSTVTAADGTYALPGLPPDDYFVRVSPLDPNGASRFLSRPADLDPGRFAQGANTSFLPLDGPTRTITAGDTVNLPLVVEAGEPEFRIAFIRRTTSSASFPHPTIKVPSVVSPGDSNVFVGVLGGSLPTSGAVLEVSGDGLTIGDPAFVAQAVTGQNLIVAELTVAQDATPGLRTFTVRRGDDIAFAHGYLEIKPAVEDFNFDGLDDSFQRAYFNRFTDVKAAPDSDPDLDGYPNRRENTDGTVPTDPDSFLFDIEQITLTTEGTSIWFRTAPGRRYRVLRKERMDTEAWVHVGGNITATDEMTQYDDPDALGSMRFYAIELLP